MVPEAELDRIHRLAIGRDRSRHLDGANALAVPIAKARPDLHAHVARRLKIADDAVSLTPMAIDGQDYVMAMWLAGTAIPAAAVLELAEELDAELMQT